MGFHSKVSDDSAQNAVTTFEHITICIHWMYENNLFIKEGIIYDTKGERTKKYRCENVLWILSVL